MATPRAIRIPRSRPGSPVVRVPSGRPKPTVTPSEVARVRRPNVGGSQRAVRLAALFVGTLAALYAAFVLYDRTAPGGTAPAAGNGVLEFTIIFVVFAVAGALYALTPAPRAVEVERDRVTVVGRWGRRRSLPPLELLSVSVVRRYPAGILAAHPVELVEVSGEDVPRRSYLVDAKLFAGARTSAGHR